MDGSMIERGTANNKKVGPLFEEFLLGQVQEMLALQLIPHAAPLPIVIKFLATEAVFEE